MCPRAWSGLVAGLGPGPQFQNSWVCVLPQPSPSPCSEGAGSSRPAPQDPGAGEKTTSGLYPWFSRPCF